MCVLPSRHGIGKPRHIGNPRSTPNMSRLIRALPLQSSRLNHLSCFATAPPPNPHHPHAPPPQPHHPHAPLHSHTTHMHPLHTYTARDFLPACPHSLSACPHSPPACPHSPPACPHSPPACPHSLSACPHSPPACPHSAYSTPASAPAVLPSALRAPARAAHYCSCFHAAHGSPRPSASAVPGPDPCSPRGAQEQGQGWG